MKVTGGALMTRESAFRTLVRRGAFGPFTDLNAARKLFTALPGMAACDLNDFGRGGETVRRVLLTALLTAWDSGGDLPEETGVFGWNGDGCTAENLIYWRDYVSCGREAGRGGLFVATLPTIPYCETAIALRCRGRVAYFRTEPFAARLEELLLSAPCGTYLCGEVTASSVCMLLTDTRLPGPPLPEGPALEEVFTALEERV